MKEIKGYVRPQNGVWWFYLYGNLRGPAEKGFSRRYSYRGIVANPELCERDGQAVIAVKNPDKTYTITPLTKNND